jgi:hypothetical protein
MQMTIFVDRLAAGLMLALVLAFPLRAERVIDAGPADYRERVARLEPGDVLQLASGEYRDGLQIHRLSGLPQAPIVIQGPANGKPALFLARPRANTISIIDSAHVHVRQLTIDGRGIPVDAVKAEGHARWAHHITLENLTIVNHGSDQQIVAISTKAPAWGWIIRGNRIQGAGTGMYLGNSDGSAPFYAGLIEHNLVVNPRGYAIQVKHQLARPDLDIALRGRHVTIIRHNTLSKAQGGSSGALARPNLLLGHWPPSGEGSEDEYHVYGNFIADNPHEALIQAEGNVAIYGNVLRNRFGSGIHIQPHNDVPRAVRILHNTIIARDDPIVVRVREASSLHQQAIAGNAIFAGRPIQGGVQERNVRFGLEEAKELLNSSGEDRPFDPYPRDERLRCPQLEAVLVERLSQATCDFNATVRTTGYCGAYAGHGRNPGWLPRLALKPRGSCAAR